MKIEIISQGLMTTIQDNGRYGFQANGISVSGCMDQRALYDANILVNNLANEAVFEMQYIGGTFGFDGETFIALTGADMQPSLNGKRIQNYTAYHVKRGDVLECGRAITGRFSYLAVAGGIDVPTVLGSKSTNMKIQIGGFEGHVLQTGDQVFLNCETKELLNEYLKEDKYLLKTKDNTLRVLLGPQDEFFTQNGITTLLENEYTVTDESDRMGFRLDGPAIESKDGVDILSDGIALGSIQIPPKGTPIILLADRQTTGGYAKIGTVISTDIPLLVQSMPGEKIRFQQVTFEEAMRIKKKEEKSKEKFRRRTGYCMRNVGYFQRKRKGW